MKSITVNHLMADDLFILQEIEPHRVYKFIEFEDSDNCAIAPYAFFMDGRWVLNETSMAQNCNPYAEATVVQISFIPL